MREHLDECRQSCNAPAENNSSLTWDEIFGTESNKLSAFKVPDTPVESFYEQMDRVENAYRQGGMRQNPEKLMDESKALVDRATDDYIDTWHKLKPQFQRIEPAVTAANNAIEDTLAEAAKVIDSMSDPEKSLAQKSLQLYQDLKEFPQQSRTTVLADMRTITGFKDIAASLSQIEDDYLMVFSQMSQISKTLKGPLLQMHFAAAIASRIHYSYFGQDEQRNKDIDLLAERKNLIMSTIGTRASTLLGADEPYLQDKYKPGAQPVKLSKSR